MRGFLLLETALALFLATTATLALVSWYMHTISVQTQAVNRLKALTLACSTLERMQVAKKLPIDGSKQDIFTVEVQHTKDLLLTSLVYCTVVVKWYEYKKLQTVELTTALVIS